MMKAPDTVQPKPRLCAFEVASKLPFVTSVGPNSLNTGPANAVEPKAAAKADTSPTRRVLARFMSLPIACLVRCCKLPQATFAPFFDYSSNSMGYKKSDTGFLERCKESRQS